MAEALDQAHSNSGMEPEVPPGAGETGGQDIPAALRAHLQQVLKQGPEFPVFAQNVQELLDIPADSYFPVQEVASVILRDISLTTQILKVVNTVQYGAYARQIHTITTAVMVMGMERIRDLAVSLKIIEKLKHSKGLAAFKKLAMQSLMRAIFCQELARQNRSLRTEEVFISALLYNIGELIAAYYLPEEYQEVLEVREGDGISLSQAALKVLKTSLHEIGSIGLKSWGLPEDLRERLGELHQSQVYGVQAELKRLIRTAAELSDSLKGAGLTYKEWLRKGKRVCRGLGMEDERLQAFLTAGLDRFRELARVTHIDLTALDVHLPPPEKSREPEEDVPNVLEAPVLGEKGELPGAARPAGGGSGELEKLKICYQILGDINEALVLRLPINEIMSMVLEGIYRGVGFDRVVLCLSNPSRTVLQGRFGLGNDVDLLLPLLQTPLSAAGNVLAKSLLDLQDYRITGEHGHPERGLMPEEFWDLSGARICAISPLRIDKVPFGVFYMDRQAPRADISEEEMQAVRIFRDQTIIAIRATNAKL